MRKSLWRNMFKLQFYRVSMPNGPSWDTTPDYDPAPFAEFGGSSGDQERWGAIWRWMRGETPIATPIMSGGVAAEAAVIIGSRRDVERVNAGYSLGNAAAAGSVEAVSTLLELMLAAPAARRAAMYGLGAAGDSAVPGLVSLLRHLLAESPTTTSSQHTIVCCLMALGEATRTPSAEAVAVIADIIERWQADLKQHIDSVIAAQEVDPEAPKEHVYRALLSSGAANGMSQVDPVATAHQRGIAAAVQALGFIAERAVGPAGDEGIARRICEVLVPLTVEEQLVDVLPPGAVSPAQAVNWVVEGAAFALTKLASGGRALPKRMHTVNNTMPAHHSDPRYAHGLLLSAVQRVAPGPLGATGALAPMLAAKGRWEAMYEEQAQDVPEPWLGGGKGGGIEWM